MEKFSLRLSPRQSVLWSRIAASTEKDCSESRFPLNGRSSKAPAGLEPVLTAKALCNKAFALYLCDIHRKDIRVVLHEVPVVGAEVGLDLLNKVGRSKEMNLLIPPEDKAEQGIKADRVIHVGVCYKHMAHLQEIPGGKLREVSQVEEQGPPFKQEGDKEPGV